MERSTVSSIKRAQKEKLLLREISKLFTQAAVEDPELQGLSLTRVKLSPDKSTAFVFFYTPEGEEHFKTVVEKLKVYKPSMRTALAHTIRSRYTPEIRFQFDNVFEKQERIEHLLDEIKEGDDS